MAAEDFNPREREAKRREANFQRQEMAMTRTMQRKYRRAVRENDLNAIAVFGKQLADRNASLTGGGGIQSAEENNRQAALQAEQAREIRLKAGEEIDKLSDQEKTQKNDGAGAGADRADDPGINGGDRQPNARGAVGGDAGADIEDGANPPEDGGSALAQDVERERFGGSYVSPRNRYIAKLKELRNTTLDSGSGLGGTTNLLEQNMDRAIEEGSKFGITKDQILAFSEGLDASKSAIADRKRKNAAEEAAKNQTPRDIEAEKARDARIQKLIQNQGAFDKVDKLLQSARSQFAEDDKKSKAKEEANAADKRFYDAGVEYDRDKELGKIYGERDKRLEESRIKQELSSDARRRAEMDADNEYYWNAPESDVLGKKILVTKSKDGTSLPRSYFTDDTSDPRYEAYKLRRDVINEMNMSDYQVLLPSTEVARGRGRNAVNQEATQNNIQKWIDTKMIDSAIQKGIDLSGYASANPDFKIKYNEALSQKKEYEDNDLIADSFK